MEGEVDVQRATTDGTPGAVEQMKPGDTVTLKPGDSLLAVLMQSRHVAACQRSVTH